MIAGLAHGCIADMAQPASLHLFFFGGSIFAEPARARGRNCTFRSLIMPVTRLLSACPYEGWAPRVVSGKDPPRHAWMNPAFFSDRHFLTSRRGCADFRVSSAAPSDASHS